MYFANTQYKFFWRFNGGFEPPNPPSSGYASALTLTSSLCAVEVRTSIRQAAARSKSNDQVLNHSFLFARLLFYHISVLFVSSDACSVVDPVMRNGGRKTVDQSRCHLSQMHIVNNARFIREKRLTEINSEASREEHCPHHPPLWIRRCPCWPFMSYEYTDEKLAV